MFEPKQFGKYLIIDKIAAGGLAELFKSKVSGAQGFEKLIAIKTILPHLAQDNELIRCFIDEAKLAALLNHQNIVQIYDFGDFEGTFYIAMQYLYGKDLRRVIDRAKEKNISIDLGYSLYITSLICSGLGYAHNLKDLEGEPLKLIHRDITPQNIIITYDGDVKIVDFGIAKAAARSTLTQVGTIKGKVAHMSPEQAAGQAIDHRSDIFSTGIILYELVTGKKLFTGDTMEILAKVRDCKFELAEIAAPNLPEKVYSIIHRALAKDPDKRYQSCAEIQSDLEDCIHGLTVWPTPRGLSQIMNSIYKDEILVEEDSMRKTSTISIGGNNLGDTVMDYGKTAGEIIFQQTGSNATAKLNAFEDPDVTKNLTGSFTKVIQPHESSKIPALMYSSFAILALASIISILIYMPNMAARQNNEFLEPEIVNSINSNLSKEPYSKPVPPNNKAISSSKQNTTYTKTSNKNKLIEKKFKTADINDNSPLYQYNSILIDKAIPEKNKIENFFEIKAAIQALDNYDLNRADIFFNKAIINHPSLSKEITKFYSFSLREKGIILERKKQKQAKAYFLKAIKIEPLNPHNHFQLGLLYIRLNKFSLAINEYQKALNLNFKSPTIYFNMGYAYAKQKKYKKAEEMFIKSINLNPPYIDEALYNLAVVQNLYGDNNAALKNLKKILKTNSKNKKAKLLLSKINKEVG